MGKRLKLPRISRPTQPISQPQPEAQPQPEQQQTMLTGKPQPRRMGGRVDSRRPDLFEEFRRQADRRQMMGFQNELDEADTKEMLGDKFGEYEKAIGALGPMKRGPRSSTPEGGKMMMSGEQGWEEQQAKLREIQQQFGLQGEGAKTPLYKFREDKKYNIF